MAMHEATITTVMVFVLAAAANTNTMTVVMVVSRRLGHVILAASWRTSCKNLKGLTFAIVPCPIVPIALPFGLRPPNRRTRIAGETGGNRTPPSCPNP